jgi:transposase
MNYLRDLIHRLRLGESDRRIAKDLHLSRQTVSKYRELANAAGYLTPTSELPDVATLDALLGPPPALPRTPSTVEPYQTVVEELLDQEVEMMTIFDRLKERGYTGSYSSIRRFVRHLRPPTDRAMVRVHTAPGEEAQVDFGSAGSFLDPGSGRLRTAYVFVMTLSYSRHQYAELVFDQKIPTWIACHRQCDCTPMFWRFVLPFTRARANGTPAWILRRHCWEWRRNAPLPGSTARRFCTRSMRRAQHGIRCTT